MTPIHWWALAGAALVALQLYAYGAWIASTDFRPTAVGPDPIPDVVRTGVIASQCAIVMLAVVAVWWFIRGIRSDDRLDAKRLLMVGWLLTYWADPLLNYLQPIFTYNAYFVNRGCWCEFIPGWRSPQGARLAEPLLAILPAYFTILPSAAMLGTWTVRRAAARWPGLRGVSMYLVACVGTLIVIGPLDLIFASIMHFDAWPSVPPSLALWPGSFRQFPLYEFVFFSMNLAASSLLLYKVDGNGYTAVERGIDAVRGPAAWRVALRILAVAAFCNFINAAYAIVMATFALWTGPWPRDLPSWLANEQCGPGTPYLCPGPQDPIHGTGSMAPAAH